MKRVQRDPGKGETRTQECDQVHPARDQQASQPHSASSTPSKVIDRDPLVFDAIRDRRSLMQYSGERIEEETIGPEGRKRRITSKQKLQFVFHDWRVGIGILAVALIILVTLLGVQ